MNVQVKKLKENAQLPTRGSAYAAGYDLYACLDGDGEITILDEALLSQYLAEWDVTLGPIA